MCLECKSACYHLIFLQYLNRHIKHEAIRSYEILQRHKPTSFRRFYFIKYKDAPFFVSSIHKLLLKASFEGYMDFMGLRMITLNWYTWLLLAISKNYLRMMSLWCDSEPTCE